ncbi:IS701 family transposase [Kitasatospora sp. NPDC091207]|uniref:IS701 family transposase n=1 Tax=Kitasatospora sp. NPDC091207 TaxID=3364083 RepID=UPI00382891F5
MTGTAARHEVLADLCDHLFASLPRSDQRRTGRDYLRGLLTTKGRKSFRNMAVGLGGDATLEQRLHHFVSCSTWEWMPMRRALAAYMAAAAPPAAWVLRPMVVPKEGDSTVGVHRRYVPALGQFLNAQFAAGLWGASPAEPERAHPVGWRLLLTRDWLDDEAARARTAVPDGLLPESPVDCAIEAYLAMAGAGADGTVTDPAGRPGARPLVMAGDAEVVRAVHRLRAARVPFVVRADAALPLTVVGAREADGGPARPAGPHVLTASESLRRCADPGAAGHRTGRLGPLAAVRVRSPFAHAGADHLPDAHDLLLLGTGADPHRRPEEVWLTNLLDADAAELTGLISLLGAVDDSFARITDRVGVRDFTGRTYPGWNRHVTLASAAHCVTLLAGERPARPGAADRPGNGGPPGTAG